MGVIPPRTADVAIVGAGCIGASIAFHLARAGVKPVVFEREKMPGIGSTGHCAGGVRQQFSTRVNVELSKYAVQALECFSEEVGSDPGFDQCGYLFCLGDEASWASFREQLALWQSLEVPARALTPAEAKELVPELVEALRAQGRGDILVVAGGVIPKKDWPMLEQAGCAAIFGPGTVIPDAAKKLLEMLLGGPST